MPVGLYVNLKHLDRPLDAPIDQRLIRRFVIEQLKSPNNPELDSFVDVEFGPGLSTGLWFFLLDSFDEIPEVLNAEDASDTVDEYATAIVDFATTFNRCRTIVASAI